LRGEYLYATRGFGKNSAGKIPWFSRLSYIDDRYIIACFYTREFPVSKNNETNDIFEGLV
jgi:hypothetical protein